MKAELEQISKEIADLRNEHNSFAKKILVLQIINLCLTPLYLYLTKAIIAMLSLPPVLGFFIVISPILIVMFVFLYYTRVYEASHNELINKLKSLSSR